MKAFTADADASTVITIFTGGCVRLANIVMFPMVGKCVFDSAERTSENI